MSSNVTELLQRWRAGDREALDELTATVYGELHRLARAYMRRERPDHTLQPTALVHEAFLKLAGENGIDWQSRAHFFGVAARVMRNILIDHARAVQAAKRGGNVPTMTLDELAAGATRREVELLRLDEVLDRLSALDERQGKLVELRFFGGLTNEETAEVLGVSLATVKRSWSSARAWLARELQTARA